MGRKKSKKSGKRGKSRPSEAILPWSVPSWLRSDISMIVIFALLIIAMHPGLVLEGKQYSVDDNVVKAITAHNVLSDDGATKHWDPKSWGGIPNVFHLERSWVSPDKYLDLLSSLLSLAFVYLLIGAIGMFYLLKHLKLSMWAVTFGVLVFLMIPYHKSLLIVGHIDKFPAIMFVPWITWFTLRLLAKITIGTILLLALAVALQIRTTHFQVVFYTAFLVLSLLLPPLILDLKSAEYSRVFRKIGGFTASYILALLLAAQPLFVTYKLSDNTLRANAPTTISQPELQPGPGGVDKSFVKAWSWLPRDLLSLTMPRGVGGLTFEKYSGQLPGYIEGVVPGYWGAVPFSRTYYYLGAVAFLLAFIGAISCWRKPMILSILLLLVLMLIWAFGVNAGLFYDLSYLVIPFFKNFRTPLTSLAILYFVFAVLAAYGAEQIRKESGEFFFRSNLVKISYTMFGLFLIFFIFFLVLPYFKMGGDVEESILAQVIDARRNFYLVDTLKTLGLISFSLALIWAILVKKLHAIHGLIGLICLAAVDYYWVLGQYRTQPVTNREFLQEHFVYSPSIEFLSADKDVFRVFEYSQGEHNLSYDVQTLGRSTDLQMSHLIYDLISNNLFRSVDDQININWGILDFMNVKYVATERTIEHPNLSLEMSDQVRRLNIYRYKFSRPRGYFVNRVQTIPDPVERLKAMNRGNIDFAQVAIVEEELQVPLGSALSGTGELTEYTGDYLRFDIRTNQNGLFVISELYYPDLQQVYLDGQRVDKVYKTNHAVQSVIVPEGTHTLEVRYDDRLFLTSAAISHYGFLFLYLTLIAVNWRRLRARFLARRKSKV